MNLSSPDSASILGTLAPVLNTALDAVVVIDEEGLVLAWNEIAERTFGWTQSEAVGRPMVDLIVPPQHRAAHCQGLRRYNESGEAKVLNQRIEISAIHKDGHEFPIELSITLAPAGGTRMFIGFLRDITARRQAELRLRRQARESQLLFEITRMASETNSFEEALRLCLSAICQVTDWPVGHALVRHAQGHDLLVSTTIWHESEPGIASALKEATKNIKFTSGVGLPGTILETGEPAWISDTSTHSRFLRGGAGFNAAFGFPVVSEGQIVAVLEFFTQKITEDDPDLLMTVRTLGEQVGRVLERKRTEEHQRLLVDELNHRVKNTLAIVQSVATQTFRNVDDPVQASESFASRLGALAATHDILTSENWEAASLHDLIGKTGLGCGAAEDRLRAQGPHIRLPPRTAVSISMALHELCTNAVKYGALSNDGGFVSLTWEVAGDGEEKRLRLSWEERGGPPVATPTRKGFGSRMIQRALAMELGGSVDLHYDRAGVRCIVDAPLPAETS